MVLMWVLLTWLAGFVGVFNSWYLTQSLFVSYYYLFGIGWLICFVCLLDFVWCLLRVVFDFVCCVIVLAGVGTWGRFVFVLELLLIGWFIYVICTVCVFEFSICVNIWFVWVCCFVWLFLCAYAVVGLICWLVICLF